MERGQVAVAAAREAATATRDATGFHHARNFFFRPACAAAHRMPRELVARFLLYYTAIQLRSIVPAPLSIYSRYSAYTADTVYSDAAYTLYSAINTPPLHLHFW